MIWKSLGVLLGAVALIILGVVGLARVTVPDEPTFAEGLEEGEDGVLEFTPTAVGGVIEVTGVEEAKLTFEGAAFGPSFGLANDDARIFFETNPLAISQMSFHALAFFPDPEDCEFTEGEHNEQAGLVAVQVTCPELADIRDNGSIALDGQLALPTNMVVDLDIPEQGGTLRIGDETSGEEWEIVPDVVLITGEDRFFGADGNPGLVLSTDNPSTWMRLTYDTDSDVLIPDIFTYSGNEIDLSSAECTTQDVELLVMSPEGQARELTVDCQSVEMQGRGTVGLHVEAVYHKILFVPGP